MKLSILAGATSQSVNLFVRDSSSTTGAGLTGLAYNTSGLTCYYTFAGANATATAVTLATLAAVNSAYSSGGFKEIDSTNMPGWYRFDIPNAALATSKGRSVAFHLKGATNMAPLPFEVELTGWDNQDGVRGGLTALPNATAGANTGLPVVGTQVPNATAGASGGLHINGSNSGTTTFAALTVTGAFTISDGLAISRSTSNASAITATGNGTGTGAVFTSGSGATGDGVQMTAASTNGNGLALTKTGTGVALASPTTDLVLPSGGLANVTAWTVNVTGSLSGSVGSVTGNVAGNVVGSVASIATGGITSSSFAANAITAAAIAADAIGASELAADAVAEIQSGLSTLTQANVADAVWNAATASYGSAGSYGLLMETNLDTTVSSRLATSGYTAPLDAAGTRSAVGLASANLDTQIGALATAANLAVVAGYLDTEIAAIQTAVVTSIPSTLSTIAGYIDTEVAAILAVVAAIKAKTDGLTFTVAGAVDANVKRMNDVAVIGTGASGDKWRA